MRKKVKIGLIVAIVSLLFIVINIIPIKNFKGSKYEYEIKIQTEVVYLDTDQGGVCPFGIWINSKNFYNTRLIDNPTRTRVKIFLETEIERVYTNSEILPEKYWCPAPADFIKFQGDYYYNIEPSRTWKWSVNGTEKSFSYGKFYTPNSEDNWHYDSIVVNNYRYLGSFDSSNINGNHKFNVLIALHVVNSEATIWAQGRYSEEEEEQYYESIINIRIKLKFEFQHLFINWQIHKTLTYISEENIPLFNV